MRQTLKNRILTVEIDSHGAELQCITNNITGQQYLWHGDAAYWGRRSPVLFPIVGAVWDGRYRMDGKEYTLGQHGFARDMDFSIIEDTPDDEAWFFLEADDTTLAKYPRRFRLEIGYRLQEERISVMWRVINLDTIEMAFHIGAHPAFNLPQFDAADSVHGYFLCDSRSLRSEVIEEKGCVGDKLMDMRLDEESMIPITGSLFDHDALILADRQVRRVSLLDKGRNPYLSLLFDAPLVGLWSPVKANAPFVCIEPWWGRADSIGFDGDFADRAYTNLLAPGATFSASYLIVIENI